MDIKHIAVCDDEAEQRTYLVQLIREWFSQHPFMCADVREFPSAEAFLFEYDANMDWQLLVLDIEMKQMNGMLLAKKNPLSGKQRTDRFCDGICGMISFILLGILIVTNLLWLFFLPRLINPTIIYRR